MSDSNRLELVISPRERDIGGFVVRRSLPFASRRMVGPFVFFDHMGPADFKPTEGMDVRPHPHIGLATVTYLFEGKIRHRDSLGNDQLIEPGAINWMTAGRGIVHSERSPDDARASGSRLEGIQIWVALPLAHEEAEPTFRHYPAENFPEFLIGADPGAGAGAPAVRARLLLGRAFERRSPVEVHSDLFYVDARVPAGGAFTWRDDGREAAAYVAQGRALVDGERIENGSMAVAAPGADLRVEATDGDARVLLVGGENVGPRFLFWNFVASSQEKLERAKANWARGPGADGSPFPKVPGDEREHIPLPRDEPPRIR